MPERNPFEEFKTSPRTFLISSAVMAAAGRIRPVIGQTFPLEQAADAHTALEARAVVGKTLLLI